MLKPRDVCLRFFYFPVTGRSGELNSHSALRMDVSCNGAYGEVNRRGLEERSRLIFLGNGTGILVGSIGVMKGQGFGEELERIRNVDWKETRSKELRYGMVWYLNGQSLKMFVA
jgi:hypothetical protein